MTRPFKGPSQKVGVSVFGSVTVRDVEGPDVEGPNAEDPKSRVLLPRVLLHTPCPVVHSSRVFYRADLRRPPPLRSDPRTTETMEVVRCPYETPGTKDGTLKSTENPVSTS